MTLSVPQTILGLPALPGSPSQSGDESLTESLGSKERRDPSSQERRDERPRASRPRRSVTGSPEPCGKRSGPGLIQQSRELSRLIPPGPWGREWREGEWNEEWNEGMDRELWGSSS